MKGSTHKKNLSAFVLTLISILLVLVASALAEGEFVCISKKNLLAIGIAMGGVARAVGELIGREKVKE